MADVTSPQPDHDAYAAFIEGVELQHIWLIGADIQNLAGPERPEQLRVKITDHDPEKQTFEDHFVVRAPFRVRFEGAESNLLAEITATFGLEYRSTTEPTESIWAIFAAHNVPLNVWPFFREFVSSTTGRMGWSNLTLPALKRVRGELPATPMDEATDDELADNESTHKI